MPPTDSTPSLSTGSFELVYSLKAYDRVPVYEFKSKKTGLTVVVAEVEGPLVNGYFCLATEAFDDDGIPHTLEHLIFTGSEDYPYRGVLDLLANRCLASGTNAWTDTDHTCYTMETAGSDGFLALMPIYLDHILYPILSEETFLLEVHHITGEGEDAGIVYCEMQGIENSGESRVHYTMKKAIYPGRCGYSSETGGRMKNLRESTNNEKVKNFHKEFYRPENLKIIIAGKVKHDELFRALQPIEQKILSKGDRGSFTRPWQSAVPPFPASQDLITNYPSDEENNGIVVVGWRGPSAVTELYEMTACSILLKYLTDFSVAPLQREFVEIEDPYASEVNFSLIENSISCLYLMYKNVPVAKLPFVKPKLDEVLKNILTNQDIDMKRMKSIIKKQKLELLGNLELAPHSAVAYMLIGQMLYGNTKEDYEQRLNPLVDLERMDAQPASFWLNLLRTYFVENKYVALQAIPSIEEKQRMNVEEKERVAMQIETLGEEGLKQKGEQLEKAVEYSEREPPESMLTCVPIPSIKNINYHEIVRYNSGTKGQQIDLSDTTVYTYFDHIKTAFVYMYALMDTSKVTLEQRMYIPLLLEAMLESPVMRDGKLISYEDVVTQLQDDTIVAMQQIGLSRSRRFNCSSFSNTAAVVLQVEIGNFETGVNWLRELLYQTVFTAERLKVIATKMLNEVAEAKRSGRNVASYVMKALTYIQDSNTQTNGIIKQQKFLTELIAKLESDSYQSSEVLENIDTVRKIITEPGNVALYFAANLEHLKPDPVKVVNSFLPSDIPKTEKHSFNIVPDWKLLIPDAEGNMRQCAVAMGCLESSFFVQSTPSINAYDDPDMPALLVYAQYLTQAEGPMWRQVRGKGLSYGYAILLKANEGLLYVMFYKSTNVVGAYKESFDIISKQLSDQQWDNNLIESAKSSLIFEMIEGEANVGDVITHSLETYFYQIDYEYNRKLLDLVTKVTVEDLNRVGKKYMAAIFDPKKVKTALVCGSGKATDIAEGFKRMNLDLQVFPSLEESFLNQ